MFCWSFPGRMVSSQLKKLLVLITSNPYDHWDARMEAFTFFSKECKCLLLFNLQKWKAHNIGPFLNLSINFIFNSMTQSDQVIFAVKLVWPLLTYNCHLNTQHSNKQATMLTTALTLSVIYKTFINLYNHVVQWYRLIWWVRNLSGF